jgi:hypothetical protein
MNKSFKTKTKLSYITKKVLKLNMNPEEKLLVPGTGNEFYELPVPYVSVPAKM